MDKSPKPLSPHVGFYRSFGRPIARVFLGAVVTYQTVYWVWVKLETDEVKEKKRSGRSQAIMTNLLAKTSLEGEISDLEAVVQRIRDKPSS